MFWPEGYLLTTKENQEALASLNKLRETIAAQTICEARVTLCDSGHNLWVDLPCCKGMIPRSQGAVGIDNGSVRDIALISRVGRPVCFTVQAITTDETGQPMALLSRKEAQTRCRNEYLQRLRPGDVIPAQITHLEPFGAFCDVGCGISSLIPIDCISVSRIFHPADRFRVGQSVNAVVRGIDQDGKLHLTHKELLGTWQENAAQFHVGETVTGIIRTVESYGSFVELTPNLAGLAEPKANLRPGQHAAVFIKSMIPEKMKVKLIIVDAFDCETVRPPLQYYFTDTHMDEWQYSPSNCLKQIASYFPTT